MNEKPKWLKHLHSRDTVNMVSVTVRQEMPMHTYLSLEQTSKLLSIGTGYFG